MGVMRYIVNWCDNKMDAAYEEIDDRKAGNKAFASGFVEGFCDVALIMYVPMMIACHYWQKKAAGK